MSTLSKILDEITNNITPPAKEVVWGQSLQMTVAWVLHMFLKNAGLVDFAWPSGFSLISLFYFFKGKGYLPRKILLTLMYCLCGLRFNLGWIKRDWGREDKRWGMWRASWKEGKDLVNPFGVTSPPFNPFFFYHFQSLSNILLMTSPNQISCDDEKKEIRWNEWLAVALWITSLFLENTADLQLAKFKMNKENRGKVCNVGMWKYSRHPNYFFEFLIWCSYVLFSFQSVKKKFDFCKLAAIPPLAYFFLVHFTGVPMTERGSIAHRGEAYKSYIRTTNMFFPWFPRSEAPLSQ
eukprot:TRINITY_DN8440_c0_g1_i2.p1 TRINITY_DN8440_c0_g1~~TRINITY_DN8440_c0_g1_i2.p1  ORF type:complete len:312 (+),score=71.15 TRINITY_DN8440_c0_g1_i2:59-937(+)